MRRSGTRVSAGTRLTAMAAAMLLVAAACGGGTETVASSGQSFCELAAERERAQDGLANVNVFIPAEFRAAFDQNLDLVDRAVAVAPDEIRDQMGLIRDELRRTYDEFDAVDFDATALLGTPERDSTAVDAATDLVDDYVRAECGIDPDANADSGPDDAEIQEMLDESGQGAAVLRAALVEIGFSDDEADCLATEISLDDFASLAGETPPPEVLDAFQRCDVSLQRLAELGGADPSELAPLPVPDDLDADGAALLRDGFVAQGFSEDEATCLADRILEDADSAGDLIGLLDTCEIPLSRLAEISGS